MKREIKRLKIKEPIEVDNFKVGVSPKTETYLVKYEDESVTAIYVDFLGTSFESEPFPTHYSKLIWQKGQQQQ